MAQTESYCRGGYAVSAGWFRGEWARVSYHFLYGGGKSGLISTNTSIVVSLMLLYCYYCCTMSIRNIILFFTVFLFLSFLFLSIRALLSPLTWAYFFVRFGSCLFYYDIFLFYYRKCVFLMLTCFVSFS